VGLTWTWNGTTWDVEGGGGGSTGGGFAAGTKTLFIQTSAPLGWTKSAEHDNKALRIVSGATGGSSGGASPFSAVFTSRTPTGAVASHALSAAEMPVHAHGVSDPGHGHVIGDYWGATLTPGGTGNLSDANGGGNTGGRWSAVGNLTGIGIQDNGGGAGHAHGWTGTEMDFAVQYVDAIICTKD
jgi:hypothetical protein